MADTPTNLHALALDAIQALDFSRPGWAKQMDAIIARGHTAAALAATADRAGVPLDPKLFRGLSRAERKDIDQFVRVQRDYLKNFVAASPEMSEAQIAARAALYAGAVRGTYWKQRYIGLPFYPTEGSECMVNCKCSWEDQGNDVFHWTLHAAEHCPTCERRASGNPYHATVAEP